MASLRLNTPSGGSLTITPEDTNSSYTLNLPSSNATLLTTQEIGTSVQAYDADTAKYNATTANFTGTLQNGGSNVLVDSDIGTSVQAYDVDLTAWAGKTAPSGDAVGTTDTQTLTNKTLTSPTINTPTITGTKEVKAEIASNNVNLSVGNYFSKTISQNITFTVSNVPTSGAAVSFIIDLTNAGSAIITWWSGVKWAGGTTPTLTASGRDVLGFFTYDGGTTWTGLVLGKDVK